MYPKLKIESGLLAISGECIEKIPYECGVKWGNENSVFKGGNRYKFEMNVNGDKGNITLSDNMLKKLERSDFQEILISNLDLNTTLMDFNLVLNELYKEWLESK